MARISRQEKTRRTLDLVGLGGYANAFERAFEMMKFVEAEILEAMRRHPEERVKLWNAFKLMAPSNVFEATHAEEVYRYHVREILERVANGEDTRPGTRAEVCLMISKMTQASRLQDDVEVLGLTIADEIFPGKDLLAEGRRASYPGALEETERHFRKKLAVEDRVLVVKREELPAHVLAEL